MDSWTYNLNDEPKGPVTLVELKNLAQERIIQRDTLVWQEGTEEWAKASTIPDLFPAPPPLPARSVPNQEQPLATGVELEVVPLEAVSEFLKVPPPINPSSEQGPPSLPAKLEALPPPAVCSENKWYYIDQENQIGPLDLHAVSALCGSHTICNSTMVWNSSLTHWMPAHKTQLAVYLFSDEEQHELDNINVGQTPTANISSQPDPNVRYPFALVLAIIAVIAGIYFLQQGRMGMVVIASLAALFNFFKAFS